MSYIDVGYGSILVTYTTIHAADSHIERRVMIMADLSYEEIVQKYRDAGYLTVPGQYNKAKENRCKICGWQNWEQADECICPHCSRQYNQDRKTDRMIAGKIGARSLTRDSWLVLRAIATQMAEGKSPCIAMEDFIDLYNLYREQAQRTGQSKTPEQEKRDAFFYG